MILDVWSDCAMWTGCRTICGNVLEPSGHHPHYPSTSSLYLIILEICKENIQRTPSQALSPRKTPNLKISVFWDPWSSGTLKVSASIRVLLEKFTRGFTIEDCHRQLWG